MKKFIALSALVLLSACELIAPYSVTFTTPDEAVIDPAEDTLDFVLNTEAYAYVSAVSCEDGTNKALAPNFNSESVGALVYNLPLDALSGVSTGSLCNVTVTVFDKTTSSEGRNFISLYVLEKPEEEVEEEEVEEVEEELPVNEGEEPEAEKAVEEPVEKESSEEAYEDPAQACADNGGVWDAFEVSCPEDTVCQEGECTYPENDETEPTTES